MAGVGLHSMTAALLQRMCGAKEQQSGRSIRSTAAITVHIWMTPQKDAGGRDGSGWLYSERPATAHAGENGAEERGYNKKHAGFSQMKNPRVSTVFCCQKRYSQESLAAQWIQGFAQLVFLFFCAFFKPFPNPHIDILTKPCANRIRKKGHASAQPSFLLQSYDLLI